MSNVVARRLTLALVLLNGLSFVARMVIISQSLSDGTQLSLGVGTPAWQSDGVVLTVIDSDTNELRDGDRLLAVNGQSISALIDRALCFSRSCAESSPIAITVGSTADYTIQRNGETQVVQVRYR